MFGMPPDHKSRTGLVVSVDRLSKLVQLAPCSTKISDKGAAFLFLDHVYQLHGMPESIALDWYPRLTAGFWRHVFELLDSKLYMSTADHPQTNGQTKKASRVVVDVLRTLATPKEWSKHLPFVAFAINNSVHAGTSDTPFYVNGIRYFRTPVSLCAARVLVGGGLTTLGANAEERTGFANVMTETCCSDPASSAEVTIQ